MAQGENRLLNSVSVGVAVALHVVVFGMMWGCSLFSPPKETVIPIDMSVVVNENLDGEENEPPPLQNVTPPPPAPKVKPAPAPEPPKVEEHVEALEKVVEKKKPEKKAEKKPEKKPEEKKVEKPKEPEPPKKTKEELRRERLEKMRNRAKPTKKKVDIEVKNQPSGNGRTEKKTLSDAEIRKLLGQGVPAGTKTVLAASEEQRCISLIKKAFYDKWDRPPWTDTLRKMHLKVSFDMDGRVVAYKLVQSSGDGRADRTVTLAASRVNRVAGLSSTFLAKNREVIVEFKVTP